MYQINLLPSELQKDTSADIKRLQKTILILLVVLLIGGYSFFVWQWRLKAEELVVIKNQIAIVKPVAEKADDLKQKHQINLKNISELEDLLKSRIALTGLIDNIGHNLPVDIFLASIRLTYEEDLEIPGGFASPFESKLNGEANEEVKSKQNTRVVKANSTESEDFSIPRPNKVTIKGLTQTTCSVGTLINNLYSLPYFNMIKLRSIEEVESEDKGYPLGYKIFIIDAYFIGAE